MVYHHRWQLKHNHVIKVTATNSSLKILVSGHMQFCKFEAKRLQYSKSTYSASGKELACDTCLN